MNRCVIFSLFLGGSIFLLPAEEPESLPVTVLTETPVKPDSTETFRPASSSRPSPEVIVEADRIETPIIRHTRAVSVVDIREIERGRPLINLNEVLNRVPGVTVSNATNFTQDTRLSIRGFGSRSAFGLRGIRLFVDGVPLTLPDGQSYVDALDLPLAETVEVVRGASSAQYGNATGGIVRIGLRPPSETPFFDAEVVTGSNGLFRERFGFGGTLETFGYDLGFNHTELDGWRQNSRSESSLLTARTVLNPSQGLTVSTFLSLVDAPWSGDAGGLRESEVAQDRRQAAPNNLRYRAGESLRDHSLGITVDQEMGPAASLRLTAFHHERDFENRLPFRSGGQVAFDRSYSGSSLLWEHQLDQGTLLAGFDLSQQQDDRRRFDNLFGERGNLTLSQREEVLNTGVFTQVDWQLVPDWNVSAGLRHDTLKFSVADRFLSDGTASANRAFRESSWNLGINYAMNEKTSLFASLATSFESPTTTELANPLGGGFDATLSPQQSLSAEVGLRGWSDDDAFSYEAVLFHIETDGELVPFELEEFPGRRFFASAGTTQRSGFEFSTTKSFAHDLFLYASGSVGSFTFDDDGGFGGGATNGNDLPGVPGTSFFAEGGYRPRQGLYAVVDCLYLGPFHADNENRVEVASSLVAGVRLGCRWEKSGWQIHPWVGVNNFTGTEYFDNVRINAAFDRFFEPAQGVNYHAGISVRRDF